MDYPQPITNTDDLPKRYDGLAREQIWQEYWRASGVYNYQPGTPREHVFSIDTPPPTVSGALHIGHVYSYTQTDYSARYQRMRGKHVFYPFGFDDNGLPSERLVERFTEKRAHEVGREEFIKLCEPILKEAESEFTDLWQSLALSCDWDQFYTTINERSRAISQASFIDLYNKGYIYRKEAPTQWCWADQTAIAQAEIEDKEESGHFHDITFQFDDGTGKLTPVTIATTRPELIPACVAVFAHPDDPRYQHLFGKKAITPLFEVEVPILPSEKADPEKGTGILMCCTFGDQEDVEHWNEEWDPNIVLGGKLPTRVIIGKDGRLVEFASMFKLPSEIEAIADPESSFSELYSRLGGNQLDTAWPSRNPEQASTFAGELAGKKPKQARNLIKEKLEEAGLLTKVEEIMHTVRHSERGGVPIEILVTPQWYINLLDHKEELLAQGRKVKWHPEYMFKRFEHWVEGLNQDWCISRQRYNGVPFPVWHSQLGKGKLYLPKISDLPINPLAGVPDYIQREFEKDHAEVKTADPEADPGQHAENKANLTGALIPDPDVMDTWATSSVTPLLNTHLLIERNADGKVISTPRHDGIFPYDMRPQAHDIIRTWAFYSIAKAYYHFGEIPWQDIVISGHAQDAKRQKISKSKGHVVTPKEMVEKYTADNLRYWSAGCKLGTDTIYDEKNLTEGKRLINKLFNATKFALRHLLDFDPVAAGSAVIPDRRSTNNGAGSTAQQDVTAKYDLDALLKLVTYPTDQWMLEKLRRVIERATKAHDNYEFGDAMQAVEEFFWGDFCDNYLELSKGRLYDDQTSLEAHQKEDVAALRQSAQAALFLGLSAVLKLLAPILPHITEECWSWYHAQWETARGIHDTRWPPHDRQTATESELKAGQALVDVLALVRKWKSERNISIKKPVERLTLHLLEGGAERLPEGGLLSVMGDLLSTTNSTLLSIMQGNAPESAAIIEGLPFAVSCELATEAE